MSLKNRTIWTILDEDSYTSDEIEWIEQHIANGGDIDGIYFYDYNSGTFNPHFFQRGKVPEKNGRMISGIYVAGVILFYLFFLVFILRRIKCKRSSILSDATVEQGHWFCCKRSGESGGESDSKLLECLCLCMWKNRNESTVYNLNEMQQTPLKTEGKEEGQQKSDETEWASVFDKEFKVDFDSNSLRTLDSLYTIEECPNEEDLHEEKQDK